MFPLTFTETDVEVFPVFVFEVPPVFPELVFPIVFEFELMLKLILELFDWFIVQFVELLTPAVLFEPAPLPSMITVVPPEGEPDGVGDGDPEGPGVGEGFGDCEGTGLSLGAGVADGVGVTEGEGLGKLAAAVNELPKLPALPENRPKTD